MKRLSLMFGIALFLALLALIGYQVLLPKVIAESITGETASFVPGSLGEKIRKIRKPVNEGAEIVVKTAKESRLSMDDIYRAIDHAREEQALAMLDELNNTRIRNTNQVFDIAKKHFPVDFDIEIFREPFNRNVSLSSVKKGIRYANIYREKNDLDANTAKTIAKNILSQKERELLAEIYPD